jgi:hypothetical protein
MKYSISYDDNTESLTLTLEGSSLSDEKTIVVLNQNKLVVTFDPEIMNVTTNQIQSNIKKAPLLPTKIRKILKL